MHGLGCEGILSSRAYVLSSQVVPLCLWHKPRFLLIASVPCLPALCSADDALLTVPCHATGDLRLTAVLCPTLTEFAHCHPSLHAQHEINRMRAAHTPQSLRKELHPALSCCITAQIDATTHVPDRPSPQKSANTISHSASSLGSSVGLDSPSSASCTSDSSHHLQSEELHNALARNQNGHPPGSGRACRCPALLIAQDAHAHTRASKAVTQPASQQHRDSGARCCTNRSTQVRACSSWMRFSESFFGLRGAGTRRASRASQSKPSNHGCFLMSPAPPLCMPARRHGTLRLAVLGPGCSAA